jgi:hypothetical protein
MHARTPIHLSARLIEVLDLLTEHLIGSVMLAQWPLSPGRRAAE